MNAPVAISIPFHPLADIFPLITGAEFEALRDDIAAHGVREPVILFEGAILDGRNRYRASQAAGVDCPMTEYRGDDAAAFVVSLNIHRRHLTESQRAMAAAKLANMPAHRPVKSANLHTYDPILPSFAPAPAKSAPVSQGEAAKLLNVSQRTVATAKKVLTEAAPEVAQAVEDGRLSVSLAAKAAELPKEDQAKIVAPSADRREMQRSVLAAVAEARKQPDRKNHERVADPFRDKVLSFIDHCEQLAMTADLARIAGYADPLFPTTRQRLDTNADAAFRVLSKFMELRNA